MIRSGRLAPGTQLPTESELMAAMNVSRTVVREAVAALKAEGLVVTRQGSGAFVGADTSRVAFRISARMTDEGSSIAEVLNVMELRRAVEVEAVALAAERASSAHMEKIKSALEAIDAAIAAGGSAVEEDFAFHHAIAEATSNPYFAEFLSFLGHHVIPRQVLRSRQGTREEQRAYLAAVQRDHVRVFQAIAARDAGGARRAMRSHLGKSIERYRSLAGPMMAE